MKRPSGRTDFVRFDESVGLPRFSTLEETGKRFEEAGCIGTITDSMVGCGSRTISNGTDGQNQGLRWEQQRVEPIDAQAAQIREADGRWG